MNIQVVTLSKRLIEARKVLRQMERQYKGRTEFYADQIAYVAHLQESLNAAIDYPMGSVVAGQDEKRK